MKKWGIIYKRGSVAPVGTAMHTSYCIADTHYCIVGNLGCFICLLPALSQISCNRFSPNHQTLLLCEEF